VSSIDSVHAYELRSRKIPRTETDPNKRCTIVKGWPTNRGHHQTLTMEPAGETAPPLEGDAQNFDGTGVSSPGEKLPLRENPPQDGPPADDDGMIQEVSSDNSSSDGEHPPGSMPRKIHDKIKAKLKDAECERQHAEFIKRQHLEQARMLRDEISKLTEKRVRMEDELYEGEKRMAERRAEFERDAVEREMRLERLEEKLQETRQKLIETIAEVKLTARRASEEAS
jgi:hypothetical protein